MRSGAPPWLPSLRRTEASRSAGAGQSRVAHHLVGIIRRNATVDWDKKERVRASLHGHIRRLP
ncbi:type I restriction enzyme endonuclease domain-containing protein [Geodermatophilus sp. YIM 151500]|uniref:type I restriction enzyme endonuclease domain-containing protein n=1 Tax=Geodermatophilus sp. YIM 151500 TaxID=2984531 RepID=UPI00398D3DCB